MSKVEGRPWVPRLRFPEFRDAEEWEPRTLGRVGELVGGGTPATTVPEYWGGDIQWFTPTEIKERNLSKSQKTITDKGLKNSSAKLLPGGTLLISTRATVGDVGIADNPCATNQGFQSLVVAEDEVNIFWYYWLVQHKNELISKSSGSTFLEIGKKELKHIPVLRPDKDEQQKIATCLSSLDELISAQTRKVDALKDYKKGLMQQLFPQEGETVPRLRFPEYRDAGEWDIARLGDKDISSFVREKLSLSELATETYVSTENLLPDYGGVTNVSGLPSSGSFTKYRNADILISNIRPYLKKVWVSDRNGGSSNDVVVIRATSRLISSFLALQLKNDDFIAYIMRGAKGVKMPRGDISLMKEYPLVFPTKEEQQEIAACLSSLDELISAQSRRLDALRTHKKGLMQQLFPAADASPR